MPSSSITGGCSCGAVRYTLTGDPLFSGLCYCRDCQRVSGSACLPYMGYNASNMSVVFSAPASQTDNSHPLGESGNATAANSPGSAGKDQLRQVRGTSSKGTEKAMSWCATCGCVLFGGVWGEEDNHTVYAGTLDDVNFFTPTVAIFVKDRPRWAEIKLGLKEFQTMPVAG